MSGLKTALFVHVEVRLLWMTSWKTWHQQNHWPHFVASSRHTCSGSLLPTACWTSTDCLRWT